MRHVARAISSYKNVSYARVDAPQTVSCHIQADIHYYLLWCYYAFWPAENEIYHCTVAPDYIPESASRSFYVYARVNTNA